MKNTHTDTGNLELGDLSSLMAKSHSYPPHPTPPPKAQHVYHIQMNKKVGLLNTDKQEGSVIIYSWTRKTHLANLRRRSLCRGGISSYCECSLPTLSAFALRPKESFLQTLRLIKESIAALGGCGLEICDVM